MIAFKKHSARACHREAISAVEVQGLSSHVTTSQNCSALRTGQKGDEQRYVPKNFAEYSFSYSSEVGSEWIPLMALK